MLAKQYRWWFLLIPIFMAPLWAGGFWLDVIIFLMITVIVAASFRFITTMGYWSFAHVSLMGVGGYSAGLLVVKLGWSFWAAAPVAILITALLALLVGLPSLRTKGVQFFLMTFALGEAIRQVWITFKDPCNIRSPQKHVGVIHNSNLCTEITLNNSTDETAVCNLGS